MTTKLKEIKMPVTSIKALEDGMPRNHRIAHVDEASSAGLRTPFIAKNSKGQVRRWLWHWGFLAEFPAEVKLGAQVAVVVSD